MDNYILIGGIIAFLLVNAGPLNVKTFRVVVVSIIALLFWPILIIWALVLLSHRLFENHKL